MVTPENTPENAPASAAPRGGPTNTKRRLARGVVPFQPSDPVMQSPYAHGVLAFLTLRPDIDRTGLEGWLAKLDAAIDRLRSAHDSDGHRVATVAVGFGPTLFTQPSTGQPRFVDVVAPAGFSQLPPVPAGTPVSADVVLYVLAVAEAEIASFLAAVATGPDIASAELESGYKSWPDRDAFGYLDGVRNARTNRNDVVFVESGSQPEEPHWADGGTYLAYMRILQNVEAFNQLPAGEQDNVVGRDREGRRLDLPAGTRSDRERGFTSEQPPVASHVRKAGPRGGELHDSTQIFRRGLPFYETRGGRLVQGLQFVSFQASLAQFDAVFGRWMLNADFPHPGAGVDALFAGGFLSIERWGFYFVPPDTDGPIGTGIFSHAPVKRQTKSGRIAVRKRLVDAAGGASRGDLAGFTFQITKLDGTPVAEMFSTNSHGHALSPEVPAGEYLLTEQPPVPPQPPMPAAAPQPVTLKSARVVVEVVNQMTPGSPMYGG